MRLSFFSTPLVNPPPPTISLDFCQNEFCPTPLPLPPFCLVMHSCGGRCPGLLRTPDRYLSLFTPPMVKKLLSLFGPNDIPWQNNSFQPPRPVIPLQFPSNAGLSNEQGVFLRIPTQPLMHNLLVPLFSFSNFFFFPFCFQTLRLSFVLLSDILLVFHLFFIFQPIFPPYAHLGSLTLCLASCPISRFFLGDVNCYGFFFGCRPSPEINPCLP